MEVLLPLSAYNISITGNNEKRFLKNFRKFLFFRFWSQFYAVIQIKISKRRKISPPPFAFSLNSSLRKAVLCSQEHLSRESLLCRHGFS